MCVPSLGSGLTDHRIRPRGNQEEQHLRADDDWTNLVQCNELRGVEQEGGAGHRTSHQTFKGDSCYTALLFFDCVAVMATSSETRDLKKLGDVTLKVCL